MRNPVTNTDDAEKKRVAAAIEEACHRLGRIALDITSWTDQGSDILDPVQERRHAIAMVKIAADNLLKADLSVIALLLGRAIPALERTRPAKRSHGHGTEEWGERNRLIAETEKFICQKYKFKAGRSSVTKDHNKHECAHSIISQALKKLEIELGDKLKELGFDEKPKFALSEKTIRDICRAWNKSPD